VLSTALGQGKSFHAISRNKNENLNEAACTAAGSGHDGLIKCPVDFQAYTTGFCLLLCWAHMTFKKYRLASSSGYFLSFEKTLLTDEKMIS